jgi:hypothetical protein
LDWADGGPTAFASLEVRVGVFTATLWAIIALIGDFGALQAEAAEHWVPVVGFLIVLSAIFQVYFVVLVWASTRKKGRGFGVAVVATHPRLPWALRPVISLVWLFNFLMGCMYILVIEQFIVDPESRIPPRLWFMRALIGFVCAYATYLYLLLAIGTLAGNSRVVNAIWRCRFLVDAVLTVVLILHGV